MNQIAPQQERIPMDSVSVSNTGTGTKIAPQNLGEVVKFAEVMARADIALPKHLRGNAGACMAVALQALEWQMSPFAVASKSYSVGGAIAYEAQLIAAVVNTRSGIKGRLRYQFDGEGPTLTCTVTGMLDGEECVYTSPPMGSITTKNSPLWKSDPQQQLGYFAARSWARRHCPEVILGVYDRDEAEEFRGPDNAKDVTPAQPSVMDRLRAAHKPQQEAQGEREGFSQTFNQFEGESDSEPAIDHEDHNPGETTSQASPESADGKPPSSADEEAGAVSPSSPASSNNPADKERLMLIRFARDVLPRAADMDTPIQVLNAIEARWKPQIAAMGEEAEKKSDVIVKAMRAIRNGKTTLEAAASHFAEVLVTTEAVIMGEEEV